MPKKVTAREDELSSRSTLRRKLLDLYRDVEKGYDDQRSRADDTLDYWDIHNCKLGERQYYNGNSRIFLPIVKDAIKARITRFTNQLFPQSGRYVEVTTENGDMPYATMSLLDHYVQINKLRTQVVPALLRNGDVEGQYNVYVGWRESKRTVITRKSEKVKLQGTEMPEFGTIDTLAEEDLNEGRPYVEVLPDSDILVLPATADSIEEALEAGGSVTVMRRWTKEKIKSMIKEGDITKEEGQALIKAMASNRAGPRPNTPKKLVEAAGVKTGDGSKYVLGYETWTKLKVDGKQRICRIYYGGDNAILGCKLNPYWNDRVPVISAPVNKVSNAFKGVSPLSDVIDVQVFANDTINEAADTAHFSAMPIVMTDPEKNPRVGSMVLGLAAVWETDPKATQFAEFPELWKSGFERVSACKSQIYETLGVNPAMIPQNTGGKQKRNQAEIANEQQVDLLMTADAVTNIEESVLTPILQRFAEYDHQFRDEKMIVRTFGELGMKAKMEEIEPIQMNARYAFRWFGVEAARNAAQIQQQIAMANVIMKVPPQMYQGYRLNMAPLLVQMSENAFGPRLAPLIFSSIKDDMTIDPMQENQLLDEGFDIAVHPLDDDKSHMESHMQTLVTGDPKGVKQAHITKHQVQMQQKAQQQQQQQQMQAQPGSDGGGGGAGTPGGAQPQGPNQMKGPPGAINPDQMARAGAPGMPRRTG